MRSLGYRGAELTTPLSPSMKTPCHFPAICPLQQWNRVFHKAVKVHLLHNLIGLIMAWTVWVIELMVLKTVVRPFGYQTKYLGDGG